jgi:predicted DCC family thiol-disulfide oxidoreductase YuxK
MAPAEAGRPSSKRSGAYDPRHELAGMSKTKVYYNSACPVCDAGIAYQKRKLSACDEEIEWIDVHADNKAVSEIASDLEFVRERLHVVDEAGSIHVGSEAFAELWSRTPKQRAFARLARAPLLRPVARWLYNAFAALLYRWNRMKGRW